MIKVTTNADKPVKELGYPKLMKHHKNQLVVLMTDPQRGIVIVPGFAWELGEYHADWHMDSFYDYQGTLTLENDDDT